MRLSLLAVPLFLLSTALRAEGKKPDPQMQAVLDQLAALGPTPLEKLTPTEARKQPGAADAVKALLKKQGQGTDPDPVGAVKDVTFAGPGGKLAARVYTPKGDGPVTLDRYGYYFAIFSLRNHL